MFSQMTLSDSFSVRLGSLAHQRAEQACQYHLDPAKAEEVYLNTLSVWAVEHFLSLLGYSTHVADSDSQNFVIQAVTDVASLTLPGFGQVECRRVLPGETVMRVPPEVGADRIAYVAVQLDDELEAVKILGFTAQVKSAALALEHLQPLNKLTGHLNKFERIDLKQWWQDKVQPGWRAITEILRPDQYDLLSVVRSRDRSSERAKTNYRQIEKGCWIKLGDQQTISVVISLRQVQGQPSDVAIEFWPTESIYLPERLQISILDADNETIMEANTREENKKLEMQFQAEPDDQFSVCISMEGLSITRSFML